MEGLRVQTKVSPGPATPGKKLKQLTVGETRHLLLTHWHVEPAAVSLGFRNVDGSTLSFYEEEDLASAGVFSKPLQRRMTQELRQFEQVLQEMLRCCTG